MFPFEMLMLIVAMYFVSLSLVLLSMALRFKGQIPITHEPLMFFFDNEMSNALSSQFVKNVLFGFS